MKLHNALAAMIAVSVLVPPLPAQAGTTVSAPTAKAASVWGIGVRRSTAVRSAQKADRAAIAIVVVGAVAASYGIYTAVDNDKSNGS